MFRFHQLFLQNHPWVVASQFVFDNLYFISKMFAFWSLLTYTETIVRTSSRNYNLLM